MWPLMEMSWMCVDHRWTVLPSNLWIGPLSQQPEYFIRDLKRPNSRLTTSMPRMPNIKYSSTSNEPQYIFPGYILGFSKFSCPTFQPGSFPSCHLNRVYAPKLTEILTSPETPTIAKTSNSSLGKNAPENASCAIRRPFTV